LRIDNPSNGPGVDYQKAQLCSLSGWGDPVMNFILDGFVLDAGDQISVANKHQIRTLVVTSKGMLSFSTIQDTISGINQQNNYLSVKTPGASRTITTGSDGKWSMDYKVPVPNVGPAENIAPGMTGSIAEFDADGDSTVYGWQVPYPASGSAVGEGWFNSPAGAYASDLSSAEKASFAFVAKYDKSGILKGSAEFIFKGFHFKSTSLAWLAVEGTRMQLKGSGAVNGAGPYAFMIMAAGGTPQPAFRIRIRDQASGLLIYDNMPGATDHKLPVTLVRGREIRISP
jgi:hypothetical protein